MKTSYSITRRLKILAALALSVGAAAGMTWSALADTVGYWSNPLFVKGYQTYTNVGFVDPANPAFLQVRTGGEGGVAHFGKMRSGSIDQTVNLATGELLANYTFEDQNGDQLLLSAVGASAFQPDGRATFAGEYTVTGGTGRYAGAHGKLRFDGWARTTDFATGTGIGFGTLSGFIYGTTARRDGPFAFAENGTGTIFDNGQSFVFKGNGLATRVGAFKDMAQSTPGPFTAAFVGIIDGRFVASYAYDSVWTTRKGERLSFSAVEFVSFEILTLPDGSPVPDLSKPSTTEIFQTVEGGTGQFGNAQGVSFGRGTFEPTSPDTVAAKLRASGFFSLSSGK
jgi:hypothetical protein